MKARLLSVLLVLTLVLASGASAAVAQEDAKGNTTIIVDCSQTQIVVASQGQYGNARAVAVDGSLSVAEIAQELNISQNQVNACLGNVGSTTEETTTEETTTEETTAEDMTAEETTVVNGETVIMPNELSDTQLPDTGGPGSVTLAAGCALFGAGLIINRLMR